MNTQPSLLFRALATGTIFALGACAPALPGSELGGRMKLIAQKGEHGDGHGTSVAAAASLTDIAEAAPLMPPARPSSSDPRPLIEGDSAEGPLPIPTTIAATRRALFVFGRTRSGYVVRVRSAKERDDGYGPPTAIAPAYEDDAQPVAVGDGDSAWFAVSSTAGARTRVVRIDPAAMGAIPKVVRVGRRDDGREGGGPPRRLGRVAVLVPLKAHVAVIGRDGDAITFARLLRNGTFLDAAAKVIAHGTPSSLSTASRSPRATSEDDRVLLAWDADDLSGALETPGTTAAERATPKPGIYVRRFTPSGEPASPPRRLTRPGVEAHTLDVVVELGACAVLASTPAGFELFRFVRKGNGLGPYGGGLHIALPGGDVALGTDVVGTLAVTSSKLLRVGPGVKMVSSPLGFQPPSNGSFDEVRVAVDGYGAHVLLGTRTALGVLPSIARIDGEHVGPVLPTPWIGPASQRVLLASAELGEGLALVTDRGTVHAERFTTADGVVRSSVTLAFDASKSEDLAWPRAPVPRAAHAANQWVVALRDGRVMVATGGNAGAMVPLGLPRGARAGGIIALMSSGADAGVVGAVFIPPPDRPANLAIATIDPVGARVVDGWTTLPQTEHHYGALGGAPYVALGRAGGGLYLLANSGPRVLIAAQLYHLVTLGPNGSRIGGGILSPAPVQGIALAPSGGGAVLVATLTGIGVAARWLDTGGGWKESVAFAPFLIRGDGAVAIDKASITLPADGALPVDLGDEVGRLANERCPFLLPAGHRALVLVCEEGSGATQLAARVTTRVVIY